MFAQRHQPTSTSAPETLKLYAPENTKPHAPAWPALHPLRDDESLYFLHIYKTAGTSMYAWLSQKFAAGEVLPNIGGQISELRREEVDSKRFVLGHFSTDFLRHYRTPDRVITWLRNPIERMISEYFFVRNSTKFQSHPTRVAILAANESMEACLADHEFVKTRANLQTSDLAGSKWDPNCYFLSDSQRFESAMGTLNAMEFVGLVEYMQLSVDMLTWRMGWYPERFATHINRTPRTTEIAPSCRAAIKAANQLDLQLYQNALSLLQTRFELFIQDVQALAAQHDLPIPDVSQLTIDNYAEGRDQLHDVLRQRYWNAVLDEPRQQQLTYTFDMPLRGSGWGEREGVTNMFSRTCRWMNHHSATIDLALRRDRELDIRFRVAQHFDQSVFLRVDGQRIDINKFPVWEKFGSNDLIYHGKLPISDHWETQLTTLQFEVPNLVRPCDRGINPDDDRTLGVAIDWISVEP